MCHFTYVNLIFQSLYWKRQMTPKMHAKSHHLLTKWNFPVIFATRVPHLMNGWDDQPPTFASFVKNDVGSQGMVVLMNHEIVYISTVHEEYPTSWKAEMTIHDPMIRVVYTQLILWRAYRGWCLWNCVMVQPHMCRQ